MIRYAWPEEGNALSELALRSKAVWGYPAEFIERCRAVLTVTADQIREHPVFVAEVDGVVAGFCALKPRAGGMEVDMLFVEPGRLRQGIGAALLERARREAHRRGHAELFIESDPGAEPFYLRAGARRIGRVESNVEPGRYLPTLLLSTR